MFEDWFGSSSASPTPAAPTAPASPSGSLLGNGGWGTAQMVLLPLLAGLQEYAGARQGRPGSGMNMIMGLLNAQEAQKDREEKRADRATKRAEENGQKSALAALAGGYDPTSGITWNGGRQGMDKQQTMGLLARAAPEQFAQAQLAKLMPKSPIKLGEGDTLLDPEDYKVLATGASPWVMQDGTPFGGFGGAKPPALPGPGTQTVPKSAPISDMSNLPAEHSMLIDAAEEKYGLPAGSFRSLVAAESAGRPKEVSNKGAAGLAQLMPGTARDLGVTDRFDPRQNLDGGARYLKQQLDKFGNIDHALVAYNWGPQNAQMWLASGADPSRLPAETRAYVAKVRGGFAGGAPPVQVAQAPSGTMTDAAPAGPQGQWARPMNTKTGKVADFEVNPATGERRAYSEPDKAPSGYRFGQGGRLEPIPGGPHDPSGLPFSGNGMDAQALNIVLSRDPATPEYAAAYAHLTQPKPTPVTMPDGSVQMVAVSPQMPPTIRPPSWMGQQSGGLGAQQVAQNGSGLTVTPIPGTGAKDPKFNKEETDAYGFAKRLEASEDIFRGLEGKGYTTPSSGDLIASGVPMFGNKMVTENFQKFDQAKRNFINAVLRRESGAAISPSEFENADKQYFPQPGDSKDVIAQKRANRESVTNSMRVSAGGSWDYLNKRSPAPSGAAPLASAGGLPKLPPGFQIVE